MDLVSSALVTSVALDRLLRTKDTAIEPILREYAYSQLALQHVCNPSGCYEWELRGLGEPKFYCNGTAFTESWGRPQRDGPALRAITLVGFATYLLDRGTPADVEFVQKHLYESAMPPMSVIKADLEYVAKYWEMSSFDLWEEINGKHFFTFLASLTALRRGARLAIRLSDDSAASYYTIQADRIMKALRTFVDPNTGRIMAYEKPDKSHRTGLDAAVPLAVLVAGRQGVEEWGPADDSVLATIKAYVDSFRDEYAINRGERHGAVATGRYAEDIYDGLGMSIGNPWYLTTLSVTHVLSRAIAYYKLTPAEIFVTSTSLPFWSQFDTTVMENEPVPVRSKKWWKLMDELEAWAEGYWEVIRRYQGEDWQLSEQFNRDTGIPQGAENLTWSYAAFYLASIDRAIYKAGEVPWPLP
ncbi:hypothetical protein FRB94_006385 [Tulasnella sp. JGI-2019a]|nr:hypothetical protein FRB94_006385 [Tulasnella sp. JGI-2019a]KAG9005075.1 hypothetical protein FRB93_009944 [Tulasnella sp. JGI-2019a]